MLALKSMSRTQVPWPLYLDKTNVTPDLYLSDVGRENPFLVQEICGVGEPLQLHLRHTGGPGWRVCSMNSYTRYGAESENWAGG